MRRTVRTLFGTSLAGGTIAVAAAVAVAAELTWTLLPGGDITATNVGNFFVRFESRGGYISCSDTELRVTGKSGSGLPGQEIASMETVRFGGFTGDPTICEGPSGLATQLLVNDLPLEFNAESYNALTGVTRGTFTNRDAGGITAKVVGLDDGCEADFRGPPGVEGEIQVSYSNGTGEVTLDGTNIEAVNVNSNCPTNIAQNGDKIVVTGNRFKLDPVQTLTSP
ncbi:hypothetical protein ACGFNU_31975 [Spirillospora sp. NPDC048911]|uniref:hypothetical protein n=1 Tax=Spirillospora sp. NPDC048911 TaxID=3364527 RepID=UPI0037148F15